MFPHYLFIQLNEDSNWRVIRSTRGVARVVSFNGQPCPVPEGIVTGLQERCAELNSIEPAQLYKPGDTAFITEGCFKDLEAIVQAVKGEERVILLLNLLNRNQTIEIPLGAISCTR
ncbi:transcription elongation factor/antiterminator RfaH [Microbulbifer rhizosphaerae]|uniref:Transcription elongation factor/antiterminator RfaH n=2 Tax=Microbulbifer rhizosphaerae TaxID=1562603 RepID=A0A7W4ZC88_9GAMM|nr:transcription elongation factor/antiterminator RfaH [Microbulbifer rhizosphaerae]